MTQSRINSVLVNSFSPFVGAETIHTKQHPDDPTSRVLTEPFQVELSQGALEVSQRTRNIKLGDMPVREVVTLVTPVVDSNN